VKNGESMNRFVKQTGRRVIRGVARMSGADLTLRQFVNQGNSIEYTVRSGHDKLFQLEDRLQCIDRETQVLLSLKYQELLHNHCPLPNISDIQFRSHSQNQEDGALLYIFSLVGTTNKKVLELCAGNGFECNAANLIINHHWWGLLFDGDEDQIEAGKKYYADNRDTAWTQPNLAHAWVTAENVNNLIRGWGFDGEIDLLSLDMDGIDYWIWKAIDCVRPRVVVLEFNWVWGTERSVSIPYIPDFAWDEKNEKGAIAYFGASLPAFVKLGREKGYRLVGCENWGFNAFFIRDDVGENIFDEIEASKCFEIPMQQKIRQPSVIRGLLDPRWQWVEV
jgi:hypothetical protein